MGVVGGLGGSRNSFSSWRLHFGIIFLFLGGDLIGDI